MRTLSPAPRTFIDPTNGGPAFGSFIGPLPSIDLRPSAAVRMLRRKKWLYLAIASDEVWLSLAVVRMGYATSAFAFVFDLRGKTMLVDRAIVGTPRAAEVADGFRAPGTLARFRSGRTRVAVERASEQTSVHARFDGLELDATYDERAAPPSIAAIAELGPSLVSATEKRALVKVEGTLVAGGRRFSLDRATLGYDYTHGLMPRHTRWQWAFAMGRAKDGAPIAFNLVSGFVGEAECAAFRANAIHPLAEPQFDVDLTRPSLPWRLAGEGIDLTFDVGAVHEQRTQLLLVRSRFIQPVGTFRGTVRIDALDVELDGVPGVVEDQDVLW